MTVPQKGVADMHAVSNGSSRKGKRLGVVYYRFCKIFISTPRFLDFLPTYLRREGKGTVSHVGAMNKLEPVDFSFGSFQLGRAKGKRKKKKVCSEALDEIRPSCSWNGALNRIPYLGI